MSTLESATLASGMNALTSLSERTLEDIANVDLVYIEEYECLCSGGEFVMFLRDAQSGNFRCSEV